MNQYHSNAQQPSAWRFFVYSLVGILCFFIPFTINGNNTIFVDHVHLAIRSIIGPLMPYVALIMILIGTALPIVRRTFMTSITNLVITLFKVAGAIIGIMYVFKIGPSILFKANYGPFLFEKLMMPLSILIPVGAIALSLLVGYGLLEFVGVYMEPIMRPIFKTPGKSAVDAVASFVGSYSLGLLITNRVYKQGMYNKREATIIATGFSTVSATFMIIVAKTLGLMPHWNLYFWITLVITFVVTAITAWLPPIINESTEYYNGQEGEQEGEQEVAIEGSRLKTAYAEAMRQNALTPSLVKNVWDNLKDGLEMTVGILPSILSIGFLGLIVANYTPFIDWLGYIFYPFIYIFPIADQAVLAKASAISIVEMFLPSLLVTKAAMSTKFVVGVVSVSAIIFFSALVPCILATEIKIPVWKLIIIWFLRVALSLLITIPVALLIFG
ncbi:TPA: YjiH family protein [Staphylococcus aureus]|nr:YjiH family protein [Staphylococcus aureus]HDA2741569.1 YjiH family protein [Staphylococcus aureus]